MRKSIQIKKKETKVGLVKIIELKSKNLTLVLSNYGAGIIDIIYKGINVIVRPASLDDYLTSKAYYGKTIGRTSGRLFPPSFKIDNVDYLIENTPGDKLHLHGGKDGFAFKFFDLMSYSNNSEGMSITFRYISKDLESGYPGELTLDVTYVLTYQDEIKIIYDAWSTKDTLCNITNHVYFNLNQDKNNMDHLEISVDANKYVEIDRLKETVEIIDVVNTLFDLNQVSNMKDILKKQDYDHTFILSQFESDQLKLYDKQSKIGLNVFTDYPSIVVYTHNYPDNDLLLNCNTDGIHSSVTAECQNEPAGIYHPTLNQSILRKDAVYHHETKFRFYNK